MNQRPAVFAISPRTLFLGALIWGVLVRIAPLFDVDGRLLQQWPTEDGYLTLTIARNIARGHGFSVAEGTIPTNGTQPLATLLYSFGFWLFDSRTVPSLIYAQLLQVALGVVASILLRRWCLSWLGFHKFADWIATSASALWFLGPVLLRHSMNCLETSLVIVLQLAVLLRWYGPADRPVKMQVSPGWGWLLGTALLMGLLAWSRVDNAFFLLAVALVHLFVNLQRGLLRRALLDVIVMGGVTVLCIFPWLLFGKMQFGHWVPISGIAEGHFSKFGHNATLLPSILFEYAVPLLGIPGSVEGTWPAVAGCSLGVVAWAAWALRLFRGRDLAVRAPLYLLGLLGILYGFYYGFMFGAGYFLTRYLAPLGTFTIPIFVWLLLDTMEKLKASSRTLPVVVAAAGIALLALQQYRIYVEQARHPHFQVVEWVRKHVPDEVWLGAIQTGTLGFYHDRSINFDGKVDPRALEARLADRHHEFIVSSDAQAIVDWARTIALLEDGNIISGAFYPALVDPKQNLSVLVRKGGALDRPSLAENAR